MRVWIRPDKLAKLGLTPADVISSIKEQNLQAPAGRIGAAPSPKDQQFTYTVSAPSRLVTTDEFENIIVRGTDNAAQVRIRDVGRAELGYTVYQPWRRQGFATEAITALLAFAARRGSPSVFISISPGNAPSLALAQRLGFHQVGVQEDEVDGTELVFELPVSAAAR